MKCYLLFSNDPKNETITYQTTYLCYTWFCLCIFLAYGEKLINLQ